MSPYKIWVEQSIATIKTNYTKTGPSNPPSTTYSLISGSSTILSNQASITNTSTVKTPTPLTASIVIATNPAPIKTITISLIVKNITDGTTLSTEGPTGFTTVGTGFTYRWIGSSSKVYEVTASASNI
jgi:hypothetical protein